MLLVGVLRCLLGVFVLFVVGCKVFYGILTC